MFTLWSDPGWLSIYPRPRCHGGPPRTPKSSPQPSTPPVAAGVTAVAMLADVPTALITGPTSGLGLAFAHAVAAEGYDVVLVSRDDSRLHQVAAELTQAHDVECEVLAADLANSDHVRRVEQRLRAGAIDLLVNNAGFGLRGSFEDADIDTEQRSLDVLVGAVMRLTHAALPPMLAQGHGDIVNVSSVAGFLPRGTYGANKAWVTSFSTWANAHYRRRGVRVLALCPGFVHTEFHERMGVDMSRMPGWMWAEPDAVVREGLAALRAGKALWLPGWRYRAMLLAARVGPRSLVERAAQAGRR